MKKFQILVMLLWLSVCLAGAVESKIRLVHGPYLQNLATGGCELDYTLTFVSEKFISMVFFGVLDEGEKEIFAKIPLNIDVQTGAHLAPKSRWCSRRAILRIILSHLRW